MAETSINPSFLLQCRVCLKSDNNMVSIFKDTVIGEYKVPINSMLYVCSNIQISRDDNKPAFICQKCLHNGKICYAFRAEAKESDNILNEEIQSLQESVLKASLNIGSSTSIKFCDSPVEESNSEASENDFEIKVYSENFNEGSVVEEIPIESQEDFVEAVEYEVNEDKPDLDVKVEIDDDSKLILNKLYQCKLCEVYFIDKRSLDKHMEMEYGITQRNRTGEEEVLEIYNCMFCNENFENRKLYLQHKKEHVQRGDKKSEIRKCRYCDFIPKNKNNLWRHVNDHHSHLKKLSCPLCDMRFFYKRTLQSHLTIHIGKKKYICDFCGKLFLRSSSLVTHRRIHTGEKPFKCDVCGLLFGHYNSLKSHKFSHTDEFEHICEYCGNQFKRLHDFRRHSKTHLEVKPFPCSTCDKRFGSKYDLKIHEQVHTNERKFTCKLCGKGFLRRWNLNLHVRKCTKVHHSDDEWE